jgi:hypothetical protein
MFCAKGIQPDMTAGDYSAALIQALICGCGVPGNP